MLCLFQTFFPTFPPSGCDNDCLEPAVCRSLCEEVKISDQLNSTWQWAVTRDSHFQFLPSPGRGRTVQGGKYLIRMGKTKCNLHKRCNPYWPVTSEYILFSIIISDINTSKITLQLCFVIVILVISTMRQKICGSIKLLFHPASAVWLPGAWSATEQWAGALLRCQLTFN